MSTHDERIDELERAHLAEQERAAALRVNLDPNSGLHIRAETGDQAAVQERELVCQQLAEAEDHAGVLRGELATARAERHATASRERQAERERVRQAREFTRELEGAFAQHLADLGHALQPNGPVRTEIEERALAYIWASHGEAAAEHCRRVALPAVGRDSSVQLPDAVGGLRRGSEWSQPGAVA